MTPGGNPAASMSCIRCQPVKTPDDAGFHRTVLPIMAGAVGRLPAMEAKLKGVTAKTKPSRARYSTWSQCPSMDSGCWSTSSQAASISAWKTLLDWLSMQAALSRSRHGPCNSSAALSITAARCSQGVSDHSFQASAAASIAIWTSASPALW